MSVKLVLVAACALIDADGRVLHRAAPAGQSRWRACGNFPAARSSRASGRKRALIRELEEELGIVVKEECLAPLTFASHLYPDFHLLMPLYVCRRWDGIVQPREGADAQMGAAERAAQLSDAARRRAADPAPDDAAVMRTRRQKPCSVSNLRSQLLDARDRRLRHVRPLAELDERGADWPIEYGADPLVRRLHRSIAATAIDRA